MSLAERVAALATRIGTEVRSTEADLSSSIAAGFTGSITARRRGHMVVIRFSLTKTSGTIGPSTSYNRIAAIPAAWAPIADQATGALVASESGSGFVVCLGRVTSSGAVDVAGQRTADTTVSGTITYAAD